jgi:hypothetical protein
MRVRRRQVRAAHETFSNVTVKPVFAGFETRNDRVTRRAVVRGRVFAKRLIATPDVSALRTSAQMKPPAALGETLDTSGAGRFNLRIYSINVGHHIRLSESSRRTGRGAGPRGDLQEA